MNTQIDATIKRARGYWFVDGFTEIVAGGLFVLLAGILLLSGSAPRASLPSWFISIAGEISLLKLFGILAAILILLWLKDHFTYPRTGFVRGKRMTVTQVFILIGNAILFLLLPVLGLLAVALFTTSAESVLASMPAWFPVGLGLIWAILCFLAGEWMGLRRFRLLGALILPAGLAMGIWQLALGLPAFPSNVQPGILQPAVFESIRRTLTSLSLLTLISGLLLMLSGILTFLRYRKENPFPYTEGV